MELPDLIAHIPAHAAEIICRRVSDQLKEALSACGPDEDVEGWAPTPKGPMRVRDLGYHGAHLMVVYVVDEQRANSRLLVSPEAFQLLLLTVKKDPQRQRTPIGFSGDAGRKRG
jgi:hypothetical protein